MYHSSVARLLIMSSMLLVFSQSVSTVAADAEFFYVNTARITCHPEMEGRNFLIRQAIDSEVERFPFNQLEGYIRPEVGEVNSGKDEHVTYHAAATCNSPNSITGPPHRPIISPSKRSECRNCLNELYRQLETNDRLGARIRSGQPDDGHQWCAIRFERYDFANMDVSG